MARPKGYERQAALIAARDLFWEQGYEATSITDLEHRTGLNRSSLYQEFGSKRNLFETALQSYADEIIAALLADLREPDADLDTIVALFTGLKRLFRSRTPAATHGCLLVNATAELASRDPRVRPAARRYRDQLRASFAAALTCASDLKQIDPAIVQDRADLLAAALMGVWLTVRIDAQDASRLCTTIASEVASWRKTSPKPPRRRSRTAPNR